MNALVIILRVLLPIAYGSLVAYFGRTFFRTGSERASMKHALTATYILLAVHAIYIGTYSAEYHRDLVATVPELCSLIAFTLLAVYVLAELRTSRETSGTGFFAMLIAFVLQLISSLSAIDQTAETKAILHDPIFNLHVTTAVFGYAAFMLAAIYGGLYLLLFRSIRSNRFGAIFEHIPSLEQLERYGLRATAFGFIFLTLSIAFGVVLYSRVPLGITSAQFLLDPKVLLTLLVWLVFGATLLVRSSIHIEGRRLVLFWMSGFVLTVVSMTIVNWIGTAFHKFF